MDLQKKIEEAIEEMSSRLPPGIEFQKEFFRQADFIEVALENILHALRDGALLVLVVLFLFLGNFRITFISILAIPLSLSVTFLVFQLSGVELNTMTLGGIGIAIGALVDDAIIDVENVFRRLRENAQLEQGKHVLDILLPHPLWDRPELLREWIINDDGFPIGGEVKEFQDIWLLRARRGGLHEAVDLLEKALQKTNRA